MLKEMNKVPWLNSVGKRTMCPTTHTLFQCMQAQGGDLTF